ncbi:MAG: tail fiber domain-containing protein, partial [Chitinophagales bacterium]
SIAIGATIASGNDAVAIGRSSNSSGIGSITIGTGLDAPSLFETAVGSWNATYTPADPTLTNPSDRLFVIGNGTATNARSNAMVITKRGRVGIGSFYGTQPQGDFVVEQSDVSAVYNGVFVDYGTDHWNAYHSGSHYSFANMAVRRAYIEDNTGNYVQPSDKNLKSNIETLPNVMDGVLRLNPVSYVYKSSSDPSASTLGFLAQEVGEVFPDVVRYSEDGTPGLAYDLFSILSIKAIQEQQVMIDEQKVHIAEQMEYIQEQQEQIESLIKEMNAMKSMLRDIQ